MEIIEPSVELLWITPNAVSVIEDAARTCYRSQSSDSQEASEAFVHRVVLQRHHESVAEHASASFRIVCDRGILAELTRHRIASFSVESTRYVNYTKSQHGGGEIKFILPLGMSIEQEALVLAQYKASEDCYNALIASGSTPQQARDVLPQGLKTELVMTANLREWMHILRLRTDKAAHPKMRVIAKQIYAILHREVPCLFPLMEDD